MRFFAFPPPGWDYTEGWSTLPERVEPEAIRTASVEQPLSRHTISDLTRVSFKTFVKFVADINRGIIAFGGELHADAEAFLLKDGSQQRDLWGGNFFPADETIEFTALINIRPGDNNPSMEVLSSDIKDRMKNLLTRVIQ